MNDQYQPPCTITPEILKCAADISELIGRLSVTHLADRTLRLRRISRIKTVHGSLAIEGNTLSVEQITAILEGKRVLAPPKEINEVENALDVYEQLGKWDPASLKDLLMAHKVLMKNLVQDSGEFRSGGAGVMKGSDVVHMAPPASMVPTLINQLLKWVKTGKYHPLITSSILHYEFEYIHPFADGNGRMGRLWQTLILSRWNPLFAWLPVENIIHKQQKCYYVAIESSTRGADTGPFVAFMLEAILEAVKEVCIFTPEVAPEVTPEVRKLLEVLKSDMSRSEIMAKLHLNDEKNFRVNYIQAALAQKFIERTIPDKPNSRLQKYRTTKAGEDCLKGCSK